jgi:hypothetical protein
MASPTLHPGQVVTARVSLGSATDPVRCNLYVRHFDEDGELRVARGPVQKMEPGDGVGLEWRVSPTGGLPIGEVGVEVRSDAGARGVLHLDRLDWSGAPDTVLGTPGRRAEPCERAWVNGADRFRLEGSEGHYRIVQNQGLGLAIQGSREWTGYCATVEVEPHLCSRAGLAVHCQGMKRFYALLLSRSGEVELVRWFDEPALLARAEFDWQLDEKHTLSLCYDEGEVIGTVDGKELIRAHDERLPGGAVALVCEEGRTRFGPVTVEPL